MLSIERLGSGTETKRPYSDGNDEVKSLVTDDELIFRGRIGKRWNEHPQWMQAEKQISSEIVESSAKVDVGNSAKATKQSEQKLDYSLEQRRAY